MLSKSYRIAVSQLSSRNMEHLYNQIMNKELGINRHYAPHLQMQALLSADPNIIEEIVKKFTLEALYEQSIRKSDRSIGAEEGDRSEKEGNTGGADPEIRDL
jgi:hypothetical protein